MSDYIAARQLCWHEIRRRRKRGRGGHSFPPHPLFCPPERFGSCRAAGAALVGISFKKRFELRSIITTGICYMITYEDFKKIELKTAKILKAERIEGSDKLLKLEIEVGKEIGPLVAGIGKTYAPDELIGKTIIVVANLGSRMIMGHESRGMLLAASNENEGPILLTVAGEINSGSEVK